jgi:hypothetical protein
MLSNNRWLGAHARTWNHGGTVAPMASCHPLWLRTVVAAAMPKTAASPAGYGITSHAPPQEAGAWSSYRLARFDVSATADGDGGYVSAASANFDASATAAAEGHGLTTLAANFDFAATAAAAAEAIFACSANFDFDATAAMDATAPWEGSANFDFAASAAAAAEAAWEGSASFDFAASASGAAGYVSAASASFDFAADWLNPVGHGVWAGTTEPDDEALTVDGFVAAMLAALQATAIPVDIAKVNGIGVDGSGTSGDPWGPA